ncbi:MULTISPECIES: beta-ketoacyl synthase chain length factor [Sphingobacterium]|uniref:Beta-ketoacyl synthase chain length factor n=1 Tax=Sphingobacterium hotanense TaxID=649196 RepID=A0ABT7NKF7_9SPHI|nr:MULTISPECIES: beta-ketoacyl synthase chain length factor [Sphingobacterium]MDM1047630.1 beta-ketoacyl synthase chain length factor [Sphingobacterium hotanense]
MKCYINGLGSIGIQSLGFNVWSDEPCMINISNKVAHPSYKELIPAGALRRMSASVKMGIYAAHQAMQEAHVNYPDAIITGTGLGCLQDSEKFLDAMIENDEEYLTPTSFIQSTHNTVAAQIALQLCCKAYNFTYVNGANSFEAALFDAMLQIASFGANSVLVGGIDETSTQFDRLFQLSGLYKTEGASIDFKKPSSSGACLAEGANFFVLSNERQQESYAQLVDVHYFNRPQETVLSEVEGFLGKNSLQIEDIDLVFLGYNADSQDQGFFETYASLFPASSHAYYQHLSGSFFTASAFGLKLAAEVLKIQQLPSNIIYNDIKPKQLKTILLINQSRGVDNSLVLIQSC